MIWYKFHLKYFKYFKNENHVNLFYDSNMSYKNYIFGIPFVCSGLIIGSNWESVNRCYINSVLNKPVKQRLLYFWGY